MPRGAGRAATGSPWCRAGRWRRAHRARRHCIRRRYGRASPRRRLPPTGRDGTVFVMLLHARVSAARAVASGPVPLAPMQSSPPSPTRPVPDTRAVCRVASGGARAGVPLPAAAHACIEPHATTCAPRNRRPDARCRRGLTKAFRFDITTRAAMTARRPPSTVRRPGVGRPCIAPAAVQNAREFGKARCARRARPVDPWFRMPARVGGTGPR